jgi:uncharacterized membrane protein (UPF0127 family)
MEIALHFHEQFKSYKKISLKIKGQKYTLAVADTPVKRKIGLSKIKKLPRSCGMIFIYDKTVDHAFTMQKTSIPLTIIFLDKNFKIVDLFKCRPFQKKLISPSNSYTYVVEI